MADRTLHTVTPLTEEQQARRFDPTVLIKIETGSSRLTIRRNWERETAANDSPYGYAEQVATERSDQTAFELRLGGTFDLVRLSQVILAEITRQQEETAR